MSISPKPRFISFEGIDGSGKSTQISMLAAEIKHRGGQVVQVREPGATQISEKIRDILLHTSGDEMSGRTEALLMTASRAQLTHEVILPALEAGKWVLADRFADSTLAYQGGGRLLDIEWLITLNKFATFNREPDLTFFIDVTPEEGLTRRNRIPDRIEKAGVGFQQEVRRKYFDLMERFPRRIIRIDGGQQIPDIQSDILAQLTRRKLL